MKIKPETLLNGQVLLINKPKKWTSFDVVNKIRNDIRHTFRIPFIKIGHAGSLDPLATGLLIVCTGRATKQIEKFQNLEKEYAGTFMLGVTTASYDLETPITEHYPITHLNPKMIQAAAKKFVGNIWQIPPMYSAKQVQGNRAYDTARQGGQISLKPVPVQISRFEIGNIYLPIVEFAVVCGKGTYIRSLADDFGKELQCGAVLSALCRTRIGKYKLSSASEPHQWMQQVSEPIEKPKKRIIIKRKPPWKKRKAEKKTTSKAGPYKKISRKKKK